MEALSGLVGRPCAFTRYLPLMLSNLLPTYTVNEEPQPQVPVALGFFMVKP